MTLEEIHRTLYEAAKLKMPTFRTRNGDGPIPPRTKIAALEDYLLQTARWRGHLEQGRLQAQDAVRELQRKWDHMAGWEDYRRKGEKSVASVEDAKRQKDPGLYDSIKSGEFLVKRLSDQIRRLEHDDDVASRVYTLITGGG